MVNVKEIEVIFNKLMSNVNVKCTNREIRSKLKTMSQEEKNSKLGDKLNLAEKEHYNFLTDKFKKDNELLRKYENKKDIFMVKMIEDDIKKYEDIIFNYEKRIMRGYKLKESKNIPYDLNDYREDKQFPTYNEDDESSSFGDLENEVISQQSNLEFTSSQLNILYDYFAGGYDPLNSMLWGGKVWTLGLSADEQTNELQRLKESDKNLNSAIESCPPINEPIIVYHGGQFDVSKVVGDKVKFKGYTSASFQKYTADDFAENTYFDGKVSYTYRILLPTGTKGLCANNKEYALTKYWSEHELLLNKGLEGDIVDIDVENHIVTLQV